MRGCDSLWSMDIVWFVGVNLLEILFCMVVVIVVVSGFFGLC